jgi:hypothetical protein
MFPHKARPFISTLILYILALAACSGEPTRIAAYPAGSRGSSGAGAGSPSRALAYSAYLELEVVDVKAAAERAEELALDYGGYLSSSHLWEQDGKTYATLEIEVPMRQFDRLRERLLRLGSLESESKTGAWVEPGRTGWEGYSQIILSLRPAGISWPQIDPPRGRPLRTLERAFGVFLAIAGFLLDIVIWVVVIVGPFALLGWGLMKLIPKLRR